MPLNNLKNVQSGIAKDQQKSVVLLQNIWVVQQQVSFPQLTSKSISRRVEEEKQLSGKHQTDEILYQHFQAY